jgi:hypothetical protein
MPLSLLVPSLLRVAAAQQSVPHPLHLLLEPLLLTTNAASNKYRVELPQILLDGGGAGEMEETMMWYVINYEKGQDTASPNDAAHSSGSLDDPWVNEEWRKDWLQRMERREYVSRLSLKVARTHFGAGYKSRSYSTFSDCLFPVRCLQIRFQDPRTNEKKSMGYPPCPALSRSWNRLWTNCQHGSC